MHLPRYQFWDVRMAAEGKGGRNVLPSMISPAIQRCRITSKPDNNQELIQMLMEKGLDKLANI